MNPNASCGRGAAVLWSSDRLDSARAITTRSLVISWAPAGGITESSRAASACLTEGFGQQILIDNRTGPGALGPPPRRQGKRTVNVLMNAVASHALVHAVHQAQLRYR